MIADLTVVTRASERAVLYNGSTTIKTLLSSRSSHLDMDNLLTKIRSILEGSPNVVTSSHSVVDIASVPCVQTHKNKNRTSEWFVSYGTNPLSPKMVQIFHS
jgi:hypothetical protein